MTNRTVVAGTAVAPGAVASTTPTVAAGTQRFSGTLLIEGRPAEAGALVEARAGRVCAARRTTQSGRYSLDLVAAGASPDCSRPDAEISFTVTPRFGAALPRARRSDSRVETITQRDSSIDLTSLPADADNVPWNGSLWENPRSLRYGVCSRLSAASLEAVAAAVQQWEDARRNLGLEVTLTRDDTGVCDNVPASTSRAACPAPPPWPPPSRSTPTWSRRYARRPSPA
ncbi:MAG: hypothetical protein U0531_06150 [Dehalococcoidia bacterium]